MIRVHAPTITLIAWAIVWKYGPGVTIFERALAITGFLVLFAGSVLVHWKELHGRHRR